MQMSPSPEGSPPDAGPLDVEIRGSNRSSYLAPSPPDHAASQGSGSQGSHGPEPVPSSDAGSKKRRAGPGSRGVANLSPDQLARKRANDREAQRAIRERTKTQIGSLERRIQELTSQQPYQELQAALKTRDVVEAENADIKRQLASIVSMIQPILSNTPAEHPVYPSPGQTFLAVQPAPQNTSTPTSAASPVSVEPHGQWHTGLPNPVSRQNQEYVHMLSQQRHDLVHGLDLGQERLGLNFLLDPTQRVPQIQSGINGPQDSPLYRHVPMKHDWTGIQHGHPAPLPIGHGHNDLLPRVEYASETASVGNDSPAAYSAPVRNCGPTCPLDTLLLDFLTERRQRAAEGLSVQEIAGPRYPSVSSLLNPARSQFSHPLSKFFIDILKAFPNLSRLPERVAVLYVMFLIMRWQVAPSPENYDRLPSWVRPLPLQLSTPHPAWMDHLPFPRMRERLIRDYAPGEFLLENFFIPFTSTLSVNWPYEEVDTLLLCPKGEDLLVNPVFERHLRRLDNWTVGDAFAAAFPALADTYNLRSEDPQVGLRLARPM